MNVSAITHEFLSIDTTYPENDPPLDFEIGFGYRLWEIDPKTLEIKRQEYIQVVTPSGGLIRGWLGSEAHRWPAGIRIRGEAVSRDELREKVGMANSGTFKTYLGGLKTSGFVEYPSPGMVRAADILFL